MKKMNNKGFNKRKVVIYMHIPKTGGTTLRNIIDRQYNHKILLYNQGHPKKNGEKIKSFSDKIITSNSVYISGHIYFGLHHNIPKSCTYITMMRNPVERVISFYYYVLNNKKHGFHDRFKDISFDQYLNKKKIRERTSNLQTRFFCGGEKPDLEQAKKNMDQYFSVVGVSELFDESILLMKQELGWGDIEYEKKNVTNNRPSRNYFSKSTINKIKKKNALDIELYHYAKRQLMKKIKYK